MRVAEAVDPYYQEISRAPLLTQEEELDLARRVRRGDRAARDRMIESNTRLVICIAKCYRNRGLPMEDLVGEGNLGLVKAVDRFDPDRRCRFSTYGTWWIKQAIRKALISEGIVRVPDYLMEVLPRFEAVATEMFEEQGIHPTPRQVCARAGIEPDRAPLIVKALGAKASVLWDSTSCDFLFHVDPTEACGMAEPDASAMAAYLLQHPGGDRLCRIVLDRCVRRMTLSRISAEIGITKERVRQLEEKAYEILRTTLKEEDYL